MKIELPPLPFARDALEPIISEETINYHYGKHHKGYVDKLNAALAEDNAYFDSLEDIILNGDDKYFNNAAQVWNHSFYWESLTPNKKNQCGNKFSDLLEKSEFKNIENLKRKIVDEGVKLFGSGWVWVCKKGEKLCIEPTVNAKTPLSSKEKTPLFVIDVWEHAYYLDYQNDRKSHIEKIVSIVNWEKVEERL